MQANLEPLVSGRLPYLLIGRDKLPANPILLPGSFNPLHCGHEELLKAAEQATGRAGLFELSVFNVDKPPIAVSEIERRLRQCTLEIPMVLTSAPTFAEKAELFPSAWFALGYDTAVRLLDPAYHSDIPTMLTRFQFLGVHFVVGGRLQEGEFFGVENLTIPTGFEELFIPISESVFREDISSTKLRAQS